MQLRKHPILLYIVRKMIIAVLKTRFYFTVKLQQWLRENPHAQGYVTPLKDVKNRRFKKAWQGLSRQAKKDYQCIFLLIKHKAEIRRMHDEALLSCIEHRVDRWWYLIPEKRFQVVTSLHKMLREGVLKSAGNYPVYLSSYKRLNEVITPLAKHDLAYDEVIAPLVQHEAFYIEMAQHYAHTLDAIERGEMMADWPKNPDKSVFLIAFSVWGQRYFDMLVEYCLPSLLTDGNIGALAKARQPVFFIHTDAQWQAELERHPAMQQLKQAGAQVHYNMVNASLVNQFDRDDGYKYWHLGMVQSIDLYIAQALQADYHLLMPDTIYSQNHFTGILNAAKKGHKAITRLAISTCMETIRPELDRYRSNGAIAVPDADLAALSIKHLHSASHTWLATNTDWVTELPVIHVVVMEGKDTLHMFSPHQTIVFIDKSVIQRLPKRYFMTLDSELDKVIPADCPIYLPQAGDEIGLIESTSQHQRPMKLKRAKLHEFCQRFWFGAQNSMEYWRFFSEPVVDPLNRALLPGRGYMNDTALRYAKQTLMQAIKAHHPNSISPQRKRRALEALNRLKDQPHAPELKEKILKAEQTVQALPLEQPPPSLNDLYAKSILRCVELRVHRWWEFLSHAQWHDSLELYSFLRECLLRRGGDYQSYLRISHELLQHAKVISKQNAYYMNMIQHFAHVMDDIDSGELAPPEGLDDGRTPFVIGFAVWGEHYVQFFLNYCLPSLLSEGNLSALATKRQPVFFIHTDEESMHMLEQSPAMQRAKDLGVWSNTACWITA